MLMSCFYSSKTMQLAREQLTRRANLRASMSHCSRAPSGQKNRRGVSLASSTRSFPLSVEENSKQRIVALCLLTRPFEPRSSRLYDVGGLSVLGDIDADAIVKSSTNLQNSVSLNCRMLAYAATIRSARTRAWRSP
jgi:hypothetical protein